MALKIGDMAPNFSFLDRDGTEKTLYDLSGKKIVFFFPEAFTPGCTAQACSMNENYDILRDKGTEEIIGISMDDAEKQERFRKKHDIEYPLVSDTSGEISKAYDVFNNFLLKKISGRVTYTINEDNVVTHVVDSGIMGKKSGPLSQIGDEILNLICLD